MFLHNNIQITITTLCVCEGENSIFLGSLNKTTYQGSIDFMGSIYTSCL